MRENMGPPAAGGVMVRGLDYAYPRTTWRTGMRNCGPRGNIVFSADSFGERGFLNERWTARNCPGPFYFAPQREKPSRHADCHQSRHLPRDAHDRDERVDRPPGRGQPERHPVALDELNREILDALDAAPAGLSESTAWDLIDFLRPDGRFPEYYNRGAEHPWQEVEVHGSVTLCELRGRTMRSRFGYYGDRRHPP